MDQKSIRTLLGKCLFRCPNDRSCDESLYQCLMNAAFLQARRAAADAAAGAAETISRMRLEAAATITESADRLVRVQYALILVESTCDLIPIKSFSFSFGNFFCDLCLQRNFNHYAIVS